MIQTLDLHTINPQDIHLPPQPAKTTKNLTERVGEEWPKLLSKKWLAIYFGCFNGREILRRRFRTQVLTPEVLRLAGISEERAYSRSTKTFTATESIMLTQILRGFCLIACLALCTTAFAQNETELRYSHDKYVNDTILGVAMITDSIIRMVQVGTGFRYEKVMTGLVVDAYMVKQYRFLVRATDGGEEPFDLNQSFHLLTGGLIDPKRILMFKQSPK